MRKRSAMEKKLETILVSACLAGESVRYNGSALQTDSQWLGVLAGEHKFLSFCPEVAAGLPVPRACAEIVGGNGCDVLRERAEVRDAQGMDLSCIFRIAAAKTLEICRKNGISVAIMAENSPSCGSNTIYDGSFSGRRKAGMGVTAALLVEHGIKVFSQDQIEALTARGDAGSVCSCGDRCENPLSWHSAVMPPSSDR
jgi:uncharacterized protein YbbK (DUF523 family)